MNNQIEVIERGDGAKSFVEVLQYQKLLGSNDTKTAERLFYASQSGMHLRQIKITVNGGEVMIESGQLHFMKGNLTLENKIGGLGGLAKKMLTSSLTNEETFKPTYAGTGEIYLEPTFGHFIVAQLDGEEMIMEKGMFIACEGGTQVGAASQKNVSSALFGGEGFIQTRVVGKGWCVLNSPVPASEVVRCKLVNEKLSVDGNFAILRKGSIDFRVEKSSKSLIGTATSGEGLLQTFAGTGEVWLAPTLAVYERIQSEGLGKLSQARGSTGQNTR